MTITTLRQSSSEWNAGISNPSPHAPITLPCVLPHGIAKNPNRSEVDSSLFSRLGSFCKRPKTRGFYGKGAG